VEVAPWDGGAERGEVLCVLHAGIPDLLRVEEAAEGRIHLCADADPWLHVEVGAEQVLGRARLAPVSRPPWQRGLLRSLIDVAEALGHGPDAEAAGDAATTVRSKYDEQAPAYLAAHRPTRPHPIYRVLLEQLPPAPRILILGSGTGAECAAFADELCIPAI